MIQAQWRPLNDCLMTDIVSTPAECERRQSLQSSPSTSSAPHQLHKVPSCCNRFTGK